MIAAFASLIAPFGGFFASGVKRAFRIKVSIGGMCNVCYRTLQRPFLDMEVLLIGLIATL